MTRSHGYPPIAVQASEAAALVGAPASTLRMWCQDGTLPARKIGKRWLIRLDELEALTRTEDTQKEATTA